MHFHFTYSIQNYIYLCVGVLLLLQNAFPSVISFGTHDKSVSLVEHGPVYYMPFANEEAEPQRVSDLLKLTKLKSGSGVLADTSHLSANVVPSAFDSTYAGSKGKLMSFSLTISSILLCRGVHLELRWQHVHEGHHAHGHAHRGRGRVLPLHVPASLWAAGGYHLQGLG